MLWKSFSEKLRRPIKYESFYAQNWIDWLINNFILEMLLEENNV